MPTIMNAGETFTGVKTVAKQKLLPEFTFQGWLKDDLEVCTVYELATGLCFPRRGELWTGLYTELNAVKKIMLAEGDFKTLGHYANVYLRSKIKG